MQNDDRKMGSQPWLLVQSAQKARSRTTVVIWKEDYMDKIDWSMDNIMSINVHDGGVSNKRAANLIVS